MSLTPAQIERRKDGLGASEIAAAMGLSKWQTPLELYMRKRGELAPEENKLAFRFGHAIEPFILDEFEQARGVQLVRSPDTMRRGVMLCHLDAWRPTEYVVNAKTARSKEGWGESGSSEVPAEYVVQLHAEMLVSNVRLGFIPVLFYGSEYAEYEVPFDAELGEMVEAASAEFWDRVRAGNPPEPRTLADINALYRRSRPKGIEAPEEVAQAWGELLAIRKTIADSEVAAAEREATIKAFLGERDTLTYVGRVIATWKEQKTTRLDSKRLKAENVDVWEAYSAESISRRFLLKEPSNA